MSYHMSNNIGLVDDKNIKGFFNEYRWLSNFYSVKVIYDDVLYESSEVAYQAAKCANQDDKDLFKNLDATKSKKLGKNIELREDWDDVKVDIMRDIIYCKFSQNEELKIKLIETGDKFLEETNWWNDRFWGCDKNGVGKNTLGLLLMELREKLKNK